MRTVKRILVSLAISLIAQMLFVFVSWKWLAVYVGSPESNKGSKKWFVSSPANLEHNFIANDVWHWYDTEGISPLAITRIGWQKNRILGPDTWGYSIYFKGQLIDSKLHRKMRAQHVEFQKYQGVPEWASRSPSWWNPEFVIPKETRRKLIDEVEHEVEHVFGSRHKLLDEVDHVFGRMEGNKMIIYWIKGPNEGCL